MNIKKLHKQHLAFWRAEDKHAAQMMADPLLVEPKNTPFHFDCERRRSFASGWTAALKWMRRQRKSR